MTRKTSCVVLLLAMCCMAACSNIETPDLDADVREEKIIPENWKPLPLRVGLAPFEVASELIGMMQLYNENPESNRKVHKPDDERLNRGENSLAQQMLDALRKYGMFAELGEIRGAAPGMTEAELQLLALNQGYDLVILPKVLRQDVAYVDSNSAYGWNMVIWWMVSPIISWFIADEDFEANLHVQLQLLTVTGPSRAILTKRLEPPEKIVRSFDDFDEGFNLFSIYTTPSHFDEEHWNRIGEKLYPIADNEAKKAAMRWIVNDLSKRAATDEFKNSIRRRVALVIGVDGAGQSGIPLTKYATVDATQFQQHLLNTESNGVAAGAMRAPIGAIANSKRVLGDAADLSRLARANDDVIVYFSGVGIVGDDGEPALVLAQTAGAEIEKVTLTALLDELLKNKPRTLTLVLDCSFTAPGDRRCATAEETLNILAGAGITGNLLDKVAERVEAAGTRCIVLSATDATVEKGRMPAIEIEELAHGLFTSFALRALNGEANTDGESGVTVQEFEDWMREHVTHIAQLEKTTQTGWYRAPESLKQMPMPANLARPVRSAGAGGRD
jgi:hypothetical protein